jgi:hypothetical protein
MIVLLYSILLFICNDTQPEETKDKSDEEIDEMIPDNYWLHNCMNVLTIKVHRTNECFTKECTDVQVGNTRCEFHKKSSSRLEAKLVANAIERDEAVSV